MIISMSVSLFLRAEVVRCAQSFLMSDVLVYGFLSFTLGVPTAHYASCTINHAKIKIFGDYYIVIPICINYFKNRTKTWSFVHPEPHSYPTPSTFRAVFVDGTTLQPPPVHVWGRFCGRHYTPTTSRPRVGPFLWTARHSNHLPSTFRAVSVDGTTLQPPPVHVLPPFVDGKFFGAGLTVAVVDNCLCIRELLNLRAANGEQGEYGSD